jgi:predicted anti-sigma-YlaC factor YlaD
MNVMERVMMGPIFASCAETRAHLSEHMEGELHGLRAWRVRRHLDFCPRCQALLRSLTQTVERLRELGTGDRRAAADESVADAVIERIRPELDP